MPDHPAIHSTPGYTSHTVPDSLAIVYSPSAEFEQACSYPHRAITTWPPGYLGPAAIRYATPERSVHLVSRYPYGLCCSTGPLSRSSLCTRTDPSPLFPNHHARLLLAAADTLDPFRPVHFLRLPIAVHSVLLEFGTATTTTPPAPVQPESVAPAIRRTSGSSAHGPVGRVDAGTHQSGCGVACAAEE